MFGSPHSTLRPRVASISRTTDSVVRSQNETPPTQTTERTRLPLRIGSGHSFGAVQQSPETAPSDVVRTPHSENHSFTSESVTQDPKSPAIPTARLLPPQFDGHVGKLVNNQAASPRGDRSVNSPNELTAERLPASESSTYHFAGQKRVLAPDPNSADAPEESPLSVTAEQIRALMNRASSNDMSEGRVFAGQKPEWTIKNKEQSEKGTPTTITTPAGETDQVGEPTQTATLTKDIVPGSDAATAVDSQRGSDAPSEAVAEPTMLDRLRGLYTNQNETAERPRWRLPSPWSVFRDKENTEEVAATRQRTAERVIPPSAETEITALAADTNPMLLQLVELMQQEIEQWPRLPNGEFRDPAGLARRQQDLRLLYLIADQPAKAISSVAGLPAREQEFWQELMLGLAQYRSTDREISREQRLTNTVSQFRSAVRRLVPATELRIRRIDICSEIRSYGRIETFAANSFAPGQPILLYVELENFGTRTTMDGGYETHFDAQLKFFEQNGDDAIETQDLSNIKDLASSERSDYYQSFELNIPSHLESGTYRIQLKLWDRTTNRTAQGDVEFQIVKSNE